MLQTYSFYARQTNIYRVVFRNFVHRALSKRAVCHIRPVIRHVLPPSSISTSSCRPTRNEALELKFSSKRVPCVPREFTSNARNVLPGETRNGSWHKKTRKDPRFAQGTLSQFMAMGALSFLFKKKEEEDTIESTIAKALLQERKGHPHEAEKLLHQALEKAFQENHQQGITYIYDQMANMLLRQGKLEQAEVSFKETLRRLLSSGTEKNDPAIIEISLKLAQIYSATKRVTEAQHGYRWCIETTEANLKATEDSPSPSPSSSSSSSSSDGDDGDCVEQDNGNNLKALLGMCLEGYARFFTMYKKYDDAEELFLRALSICEDDLMEDGQPHPESVTLLNDLGTLYDLKGEYDKAKDHIRRSARLAQKLGHRETLPTILCNLAAVEAHIGNNKEAERLFRKALKEAQHQEDAATVLIIKNKLAQLETDILLKKK